MSFGPQSLVGLGVLLLMGLVIALLAMTWYTAYMLTHPPRRTYASAVARRKPGDPGQLPPGPNGPRKWSSWTFEWRGLTLPVWDLEGDAVSGPVMILSHGWSDSRIGGLARAQGMAAAASRLILWEMPGHGEAPGTCALGTREVDALLALVERVGGTVVLYGWSLGAGVSIAGASRADGPHANQISAVIAEAPYRFPVTPARNVLRSYGMPWRVNLPLAMGLLGLRLGVGARWHGFDRAALAGSLRVPLLVIHGAKDEICPVEDGQAIAAAVTGPHTICVLDEGGHHSLWTDPKTEGLCARAVDSFLKVSGCCELPELT